MPCRQWLASLSDPSIVVVIGMTPLSSKILIHVDHVIAHYIIDRLLAGSGDIAPEVRLITDAESGVLQYLCMQILLHVHAICGRDERVHFRFEKILQRTENIVPFVPARDEGVVMTVRLGFGDHLGFVRILFPAPFVAEAMVAPIAVTPGSAEQTHLLSRLAAFGDMKASVWAEAGVVTVHPNELRGLEVGDVILLDESDVRLKGNMPEGEVRLRVGDGQHGSVRARIRADEDVVHCKIEHIDVGG
jgi:flagellar motor switch protein FliM